MAAPARPAATGGGSGDAGHKEDEWATLMKHEALKFQQEKQEEANRRKAESQRVKRVLDAQIEEREKLRRASEEKEKRFAEMTLREVEEWKTEEKKKREEARRLASQMKEERDSQRQAQRQAKEVEQSKQQQYEQRLRIQQLKALKLTRREEEERRRIQTLEAKKLMEENETARKTRALERNKSDVPGQFIGECDATKEGKHPTLFAKVQERIKGRVALQNAVRSTLENLSQQQRGGRGPERSGGDEGDADGKCTLVIREDDRAQKREAERVAMRGALALQIAEKERRRQCEAQADAEARERMAAEAEALKQMEKRRRERIKEEQREHKSCLEGQIREKAERRAHEPAMSAVEKKINTRLLQIAKSKLQESTAAS